MSQSEEASRYGLAADIGGTNARFALVALTPQSRPALLQEKTLRCSDYPNMEDAIRAYYQAVDANPATVAAATIAVAGPVSGDWFEMTNNHWAFSKAETQKTLGYEQFALINDYTALAWAIPCLQEDEYVIVGRGSADPGGAVGIIGPGTGLGVGGFVRGGHDFIPLQAEGGHASFAPCDEIEIQILQILSRQFERVSNERLLSGAGLVNLYRALADIRRHKAADLTPADITNAAMQKSDALCVEALNRFCSILGSVAGDLALTLGTQGGIYIAGGIVPRFVEFLQGSKFRERFEAKGRFHSYNADIPTRIVVAEQPGLLGAAAHRLHASEAYI